MTLDAAMRQALRRLMWCVVGGLAVACVREAPGPTDARADTGASSLRLRAERGDPGAQAELGASYLFGLGVTRDAAEATLWFRKAADQGDPTGQYYLGERYLYGDGAPKDLAQAAAWTRKAAERGHEWAQVNLGVIHRDGLGVPQDYTEALVWFGRAADQGNFSALRHLGLMHARGLGVAPNPVDAHKWLNLAAARADRSNQERFADDRDALAAGMTVDELARAQAEARAWLRQFNERQ